MYDYERLHLSSFFRSSDFAFKNSLQPISLSGIEPASSSGISQFKS